MPHGPTSGTACCWVTFQAARILAPIAIPASLGLGQPIVAVNVEASLGLNGNSIIVANDLQAALLQQADGDLTEPAISGAALHRVVEQRREEGLYTLVFGMVFPFSTHNYLLRFWMAAAGVDPDEDVRLVVVPPPYMVDSLSRGQVAGFCVGAPWPSVAVAAGLGHILHLGTDIVATCPDKVLAVRHDWLQDHDDAHQRLLRAIIRSSDRCSSAENHPELATVLARPDRLGVSEGIIRHALTGRLIVSLDGRTRENRHYLWLDSERTIRPDPAHAKWLYAQMARWRQVPFSAELADVAASVYQPQTFDRAHAGLEQRAHATDALGAFTGPAFDPNDVPAHLAAWQIGQKA